jgi:hypothetical protein
VHLVICVPTTLAKQILFLSHMSRKVVGGNYNVLVHYVNFCAPDSSGVVLCNLCTMLVLEPKEKLKLFHISITKLHCENL